MLPDERTLWGEKCPLKKPTKKNNGYYRREANKQHTLSRMESIKQAPNDL